MNEHTPPPWQGGLAQLRERAEERGINFTGAAVLAFGAVLVLFAFVIPDWFRPGPGFFSTANGNSTFSDIGNTLDSVRASAAAKGILNYYSFGTAGSYFSWLGWVALVVTLATGVLAVSPVGQRHGLLRWLAAVVAFASLALTLQSLDLIAVQDNPPDNARPPSWGEFVSHSGIGAWAAMAGFLVMLLASFAPRR